MLAQFVGFRNFEVFCQRREELKKVQSRIVSTDSIDVNRLIKGDCLQISWRPDRTIVAKYVGDSAFVITESVNSKLSVGDSFTCNLFIQNEPLYLSNLVHEGSEPLSYVAGEKDGVCIRVLIG